MAKLRKRLILTPLAMLLGAAFATPAQALGLGNIEVHSRIGEPLMATVTLSMQAEEIVGAQCFKVVPPAQINEDIPWLPRARVALDGKQLIIRGSGRINDPVVALALRVGCNYDVTREYALLLQPPEPGVVVATEEGAAADTPVAAPPKRPARAVVTRRPSAAPGDGGASAALSGDAGTPLADAQKPAKSPAAGAADRIVVHGGAETPRARASNLNAREQALAERERRLTAALDDQVAAQLEIADKIGKLERVLVEMQDRAQRLDVEIAARQAVLKEMLGNEQRNLQEAAQARSTWGMWALAGTPAVAMLGFLGWRSVRRRGERELPPAGLSMPPEADRDEPETERPVPQAKKRPLPEQAAPAAAAARPDSFYDRLDSSESTIRMQAPLAPPQGAYADRTPAAPAPAAPAPAAFAPPPDDDIPFTIGPVGRSRAATTVRQPPVKPAVDWESHTHVIDDTPRAHDVLDIDIDTPQHDRSDVEFVIESMNSDPHARLDIQLDEEVTAANDENDSVLELAEIMLSFGRTKGAAEVLAEYVYKNPKRDVRPWIKLLEVYQRASMQKEYEELGPLLQRAFNVHIPSWFEYLLEVDDASIEDYPHIMRTLTACWGTPEADAYLRRLLGENRGGTRRGFPVAVVADILLLIDVLALELADTNPDQDLSLAA